MQNFLLTLMLFIVLAGGVYLLQLILDRGPLSPRTEEAIERRREVEESHIWWLTRVIYGGFAAICLFLLSTTIAVRFFLGNYGDLFWDLLIYCPIAIVGTVLIYSAAREFLCYIFPRLQ